MSAPLPGPGLYLITPDPWTEALPGRLASALAAGVKLVQYRSKSGSDAECAARAAALRVECRKAGVPLIVNDDPLLAREVGADGVHVGRDDTRLAEAHRVLGPGAIVGCSCYDSLERALRAEDEGASYVAFGSFFPSPTKPRATPARLELLAGARARISIPVVAIGGITPDNARSLVDAGARWLAVVSAVFAAPDPARAVERFAAAFQSTGNP